MQEKTSLLRRTFIFHYSLDGEKFYMTRYFLMPESKVVKIGLLAQALTGSGGNRIYEHLSIEPITVKNIRFALNPQKSISGQLCSGIHSKQNARLRNNQNG